MANDKTTTCASSLPLHHVSSDDGCDACSPRYVGPIVGNGQISMWLDENGVMHDYDPLPARPAPRIYWAGRRQRGETRPLSPFGILNEAPGWTWMQSTRWEQTLDVHGGMVETKHQRGNATESTTTCVLADRNLVAIHKKVTALRGAPATTFTFRLCPPGSSQLPADFTILGGGQDESGCWLDYQLNGPVEYRGRIALWADRACSARWNANELRIHLALAGPNDEFTVYLNMVDDVGDDPLYRAAGWNASRFLKHPRLAPTIQRLQNIEIHREDPEKATAACRQWTREVGWAGVEAHQRTLWADWWAPCRLELPDAPDVQAIWETGFYAIRTQLTRWSIPVAIHGAYFNGQYFPDEFAALKVMLMTGHHEYGRRMLDHKLSALPWGFNMTDGVGARGPEQPIYEGGYLHLSPNHTTIYEVHGVSFAPQYAWTWLKFSGMRNEDLEMYYPLFWAAAEFFRRWMVYRGPDGKLFTGACTDFDEMNPGVVNGVCTVTGAIRSTHLAAEAARRLKCDESLVPLWDETARGLSANIIINSRGLIASYVGDEGVSMCANRLLNTPFMHSPLQPDDERFKRTLQTWLAECKLAENWGVCKAELEPGKALTGADVQNPDVGCWTWLPAEAVGALALLGDGVRAGEVVNELIRCSQNFASLYECKVMIDGFVSAPWFITSSTELSASISLMLLIPEDDDRISILSAIPESWRNLRFTLWAMNRTSVTVEVKDGRLTQLKLRSPHSRRVTVRVPSRFETARVLGQPKFRDESGDIFEVAVEAE